MNMRMTTLAVVLATASFANAQETPLVQPAATVQPAESQHDMLVRELKLTPAQAEEMEGVDARHKQSAKELNRANLETTERQARARALRDAREAEYKRILTAEQYEKMLTLRKQKRDATQERSQATGAGTHQE